MAKLNEQQVEEIRKLRAEGMDPKSIAFLFKVSRSAVSKILRGSRWPIKTS